MSNATNEDTYPVFEVEAYYPVFFASWEKDAGVCSICRNLVEGPCISCQTLAPCTQRCFMRWGTCGHAFHDHCIQRWLETRAVCPLDLQPWNYKEGWSDEAHMASMQLYEENSEEGKGFEQSGAESVPAPE